MKTFALRFGNLRTFAKTMTSEFVTRAPIGGISLFWFGYGTDFGRDSVRAAIFLIK